MSYQVYYKYMSSISCAYMYLCTCLCMFRHVFGDVCMETKGQPQPLGLFLRCNLYFPSVFLKMVLLLTWKSARGLIWLINDPHVFTSICFPELGL